MSKTLRIGLVGCGGVARAHVGGYRNVKDAQIVAVYDMSKDAAAKLASETGARAAESIEEMIERDRPDAVSVCSPPSAHFDNCRPLLRAGIAVLCEKPLEVDLPRARKLAAFVRKSKAVFMTAFCHRFHPAILELKQLLDDKILGHPLLFRNIFGGYTPLAGNHRVHPKLSGGGCLIDHCCHSVDLFRFLFGDPTHVQAVKGNLMQKMPIEDFGMIHLSKGGKVFGEITASYSLKVCGNFVELFGTKGSALVSYWNPGFPDLQYRTEGDKEWIRVDCSKHSDRFTGEIRHFLACVRKGRKPAVNVEDGLAANRIVSAIYRSAARWKRVAKG